MRAVVAAALCACAGGQACVYGQTTFLAGGGSAGGIAVGVADGVGSSAMMNYPSGLSICEATGILYSPDYPFSRIRAIAVASATVTTLAGGGAAGGTAAGFVNGVGSAALFNVPTSVAVTAGGNTVYVADYKNNQVRAITVAGAAVVTVAGGAGATTAGGANGLGTAATFNAPFGVNLNLAQNILYVTENTGCRIRAVTLATGAVTTLAGTTCGYANGIGTLAQFRSVQAIVFDPTGAIGYIVDTSNNLIRSINMATNAVTTFAGGGGSTGSGRTNGQGTNALFQAPTYVATDKSGFVYVAGYNDNSIRVITPGGLVSTLAGGGAAGGVVGNAVGVGTNALFNVPYGVSVDSLGNVYVGDQHNNIIKVIKTCWSPSASPSSSLSITGSPSVSPSVTASVSRSSLPAPCAGSAVFAQSQNPGNYFFFTVPPNVVNVTVDMWGAQGAQRGDGAQYGGPGAFITGGLATTPGETLRIIAGAAGSSTQTAQQPDALGSGGGGAVNGPIGGGGRSAIQRNYGLYVDVVTAGGGGGAGGYCGVGGPGGWGPGGGWRLTNTAPLALVQGTAWGPARGRCGGGANYSSGGGGAVSAPGVSSPDGTSSAAAGQLFGASGTGTTGAAGGGGGWYGGGAGGGNQGPGGGGSSQTANLLSGSGGDATPILAGDGQSLAGWVWSGSSSPFFATYQSGAAPYAGLVAIRWSACISGTPSASVSPVSSSMTASNTGTATASLSAGASSSSTSSVSAAATPPSTPSSTATMSSSPSSPPTGSATPSSSMTATATLSLGASASPTASATMPPSESPSTSATATASLTFGASPSRTASKSPTASATPSASQQSLTATRSPAPPSFSSTGTASASASPSLASATATASSSPSSTGAVGAAAAAAAAAAATGTGAAVGGALAAALLLIAVAAAVIVMRARRRARQAKIGRKKDVQSLKSELDSQREMVAALKAQLSARGSSSSSTSDNFAAANPLARAASERGGTAGTAPAREMSIRVPDMGSGGGGGGGGGGSEDTEASQAVVRAPSMRRAFSTIKRAEPPLAPGWTEIASSSQGTPYWRNQSTGMTSWVRPSVSAASKAEPAPLAPAAPVAEDSALPLDWEEKWSKSQQRPYFVRASTGETAWERPT